MHVHNIMEEHVAKRVNELYETLKKENTAWLSCDCESCRLDATSYVLNRITPRYIVSGRGVTHNEADHNFNQVRTDINRLALEGIRLVSSAKRPYHNQLKQSKDIATTKTALYNFPIFAGQVFDGATFAPLDGASVLLKLDGKPADMQDITWSNPTPTFASTDGHFTFWVAPQTTKSDKTPKTFNFTIEISAPEYETITYPFEVPLVSEKKDRTELNASYTLKIQDLFLFRPDYEDSVIPKIE